MKPQKFELDPLQTVLVLGGNGYLGRNIAHQLETYGAEVIIGGRAKFGATVGSIKSPFQELVCKNQWLPLLDGIDVVVNTVGILRPRPGEPYDKVHHLAPQALAQACAELNIKLLHISVLALENHVRSEFLTSKRAGEQAILELIEKEGLDGFIVRPSLLEGVGHDGIAGYGATWFKRVAKWPIHFVPADAQGMLAPLNILDFATAVAHLSLSQDSATLVPDRIAELGGVEKTSLTNYLYRLREKPPWVVLKVPMIIAKGLSHVFDAIHFSPFSFGHYELLKKDNLPKVNQLATLLHRAPLPLNHSTSEFKASVGIIGTHRG